MHVQNSSCIMYIHKSPCIPCTSMDLCAWKICHVKVVHSSVRACTPTYGVCTRMTRVIWSCKSCCARPKSQVLVHVRWYEDLCMSLQLDRTYAITSPCFLNPKHSNSYRYITRSPVDLQMVNKTKVGTSPVIFWIPEWKTSYIIWDLVDPWMLSNVHHPSSRGSINGKQRTSFKISWIFE